MVARGDPCRCPVHKCTNLTSEPKWARCRPCAVGNHVGGVCSFYTQESRFNANLCVCGYDRIDHQAAIHT